MKLLPDWKYILKSAWSVKFMAFAAVISGCETIMQFSGTTLFSPGIASASIGVLTALGILARLLAQKEAEEIAGTDAKG